jgi:hypothetical protein
MSIIFSSYLICYHIQIQWIWWTDDSTTWEVNGYYLSDIIFYLLYVSSWTCTERTSRNTFDNFFKSTGFNVIGTVVVFIAFVFLYPFLFIFKIFPSSVLDLCDQNLVELIYVYLAVFIPHIIHIGSGNLSIPILSVYSGVLISTYVTLIFSPVVKE